MGSSITRRCLIAGLGIGTLIRAQNRASLRAGVATTNITPTLGANIAGSMRNQTAVEVHDELHAKALVLDSGGQRLAFVVCDLCAIAPEVIAAAKGMIRQHTGIEPHRVLVSATHSHSAPAAARLFQSEPDPKYRDFLATRISDAVRLGVHRLQPAKIGWGVGKEERLVFNRRFVMQPGAIPADPFGRTTDQVLMNPGVGNAKVVEPAGPIDPDVCILAVTAGDGKPLCALGSYALHYVGAPGATISADYFGVWGEEMRRRLKSGPEFVGILANACSGNINNVDVRGPAQKYPPFAKMREVASALAEESMRVWNRISFQESVELDGTLEELDLAVRKPSRQEVEDAKRMLPADTTNVSDRSHIYAKETVQMSAYPDRVKAPVQAMRIGDLGIATFPGEAFVELGMEVKKRSPFQPTFIIELANSYLGYIPTVEGHKVGGYETWRAKSSFLERDAAPKMVDSAIGQLQRLKRH
jgi:neutral ceramidase